MKGDKQAKVYLSEIFPFRANEIAFMNSVVLGTSANKVIPKNFSSIPEPFSTTSTISTRSSSALINQRPQQNDNANVDVPAMRAYKAVHDSNTAALVIRLHSGASCP